MDEKDSNYDFHSDEKISHALKNLCKAIKNKLYQHQLLFIAVLIVIFFLLLIIGSINGVGGVSHKYIKTEGFPSGNNIVLNYSFASYVVDEGINFFDSKDDIAEICKRLVKKNNNENQEISLPDVGSKEPFIMCKQKSKNNIYDYSLIYVVDSHDKWRTYIFRPMRMSVVSNNKTEKIIPFPLHLISDARITFEDRVGLIEDAEYELSGLDELESENKIDMINKFYEELGFAVESKDNRIIVKENLFYSYKANIRFEFSEKAQQKYFKIINI